MGGPVIPARPLRALFTTPSSVVSGFSRTQGAGRPNPGNWSATLLYRTVLRCGRKFSRAHISRFPGTCERKTS